MKMVSTAGAIARRPIKPLAPGADQLRAVLGFAALGLLVFLALVFAARRFAGEFVQPLGGFDLVAVAALLGAAVIGIAVAARTEYSVLSTQYFVLGTAAIAAAMLLASLTFADSAPSAVLVAWFVLAIAAAAAWRLALRPAQRWARPRAVPQHSTAESEPAEAIPANMTQQLTRVREADGSESLHALARAEVPAGDRLAVVHLALCPPLDCPPELTAHAIDADNAEVRITTAETYGVRLEVRLPRPAPQPRQVLVEVLGCASMENASVADPLGGDLG
jgi:hypothetical protein